MLRTLTNQWRAPWSTAARLSQPFSTTLSPNLPTTQLPPRIKLNETDLEENFIKGGGSGGQKINKTNSLVQLRHIPSGIIIKCQETRSRSQNRTIARRILAERLEDLEMGAQSRSAVKGLKKVRRKANAIKKARRKYRKDEGAAGDEGVADDASKEDEIESTLDELSNAVETSDAQERPLSEKPDK